MQTVVIGTSGPNVVGTEPPLGSVVYENGTEVVYTSPEYASEADSPEVRYPCLGLTVVNALGESTTYPTTSARFVVENGPVNATWLWGEPQKRLIVRGTADCAIAVAGEPVEGDAVAWTENVAPEVTAIPADGYEFVCWEGNIPFGKARVNPITLSLSEPIDIRPVVRPVSEPVVREWNGTGVWTDASKWSPSGIPGSGDSVVIASGTCAVSNCFAVAEIAVSRGATLKVGTAGNVNGDIAVTGSVVLNGGALQLGYGATADANNASVYG